MRRLITLISCCWLSTTVVAEVVHCPKIGQLQKVFMGISQDYYWQARVGNTVFSSNIRRDRSEQAVDFLPQASYLDGRQPVCAYKVSILRNNRLSYRHLYLSGSVVASLTQQQQQRAKIRNAVSQGAVGLLTQHAKITHSL